MDFVESDDAANSGGQTANETSQAAAQSASGDPIKTDGGPRTIQPTSGSFVPFQKGHTRLNAGILHLYRDKSEVLDITPDSTIKLGDGNVSRSEAADMKGSGTILAVLAVPSYMTSQDFLNFIGPSGKPISHLRIIRDSLPNRYMVLIKFRDAKGADSFYRQFTGKQFSSIDAEVCHVVYIKSVVFKSQAIPHFAFPPVQNEPSSMFMSLPNSSTISASSSSQQSAAGAGPSAGSSTSSELPQLATPHSNNSSDLVELPTCPVCLERMDASVTGLVTIICHHTFHCQCLSKWGDTSCPVCRYSQRDSSQSGNDGAGGGSSARRRTSQRENECASCGVSEDLWICLVCGNIGCGRYRAAHAAQHFESTNHVYALELETQRVWDYAGDGYVHRLIQNRADGKLVELPEATSTASRGPGGELGNHLPLSQGKLDAIGLEYTYMLTSQLESQRLWYESQISELQTKAATEVSSISHEMIQMRLEVDQHKEDVMKELEELKRVSNDAVAELNDLRRNQMPTLLKEKKALERRVEKLTERLATLQKEYDEEKHINDSLRQNQEKWKMQLELKSQLLAETTKLAQGLREEVRDLMHHMETQAQISQSPMKEELQSGTLVLEEKPEAASGSSGGSNRKNKGKRR
ncbi:BRCA1-associated protein 2-domain-containing protein [Zopfochytrium polystomum]|nr:BRCA1-associated protein 2-domain-containing protein [Zopfochytrium polystomum]